MLVKLENINLTFLANTELEVKALKNVSFSLSNNESVGVIGASASSKSTFAQVLATLIQPDKGSIYLNDNDVTKKPVKQPYRYISYMFQNPEKQLFENTVFNEISFSLRNIDLDEDEIIARVKKSLLDVGLDYQQFKDKSPFNLSGGEMRRIGLASTLALDSMAFILDEPTVGLDQNSKKHIIDLLLNIKKNRSIVLISHDIEEVIKLCDRIVVFDKGEIVLECKASHIYKYFALLNGLKIKLPPEYVLGSKLRECGEKVDEFSTDYITKLIEKRLNGR